MSRLLLSRKLSVSEPSPTVDEGLLQTAGRVLPPSEYRAMLLEVTPELVRPGEQTDYFTHEQVELWGIDSFWNLPHDPRTEYYRPSSPALGQARQLFAASRAREPVTLLSFLAVSESIAAPGNIEHTLEALATG